MEVSTLRGLTAAMHSKCIISEKFMVAVQQAAARMTARQAEQVQVHPSMVVGAKDQYCTVGNMLQNPEVPADIHGCAYSSLQRHAGIAPVPALVLV